ncbi:hypothetical protein I6G82_11080 [Lysinibacillus macroides]|uniref:Lipoprotein n=1 Tax=Lysinibacillus macroides TaxID=33935 RepID=A0A0M9DLI9_9BACI|nr:hypothetical protein [Lysinibacillus macroides]KOY83073.1 hypothetical protein ADM90_07175 [Lysinibacillus macroides]QPR70069.1 hypothetical protein I6G82_11080 [Lysinibacillus macroides]
MLKKLGVLLLLGTTLTGCEGATIDEDSNIIEVDEKENDSTVVPEGEREGKANTETIDTITQTAIDNNSVDYTLSYIDFMKEVTESILVNAETITQMSKSISANPQIINDSEFRTTVSELVDVMDKTHLSVVDITPPDMLSTYHSLMLGSLEEYSKGAKLFGDGILNGKSELVGESLENFVIAIKLYNEASNELVRVSE